MKRVQFMILVIVAMSLFTMIPLFSAYLEFLPTEIRQPDGEVIECYASGDEFFNWLHDKEGFTIIVGDDGYYYYGVREGEVVIASEYRVGSIDPQGAGLAPWVKISERLYQERRAIFYEPLDRSSIRAPHTGTMNNLVIYIRFSDDTEFTIPRSSYDNNFNNLSGSSVRNYFQEVSYNQLDMVSYHYPICDLSTNLSYQDSNPRAYYQPYHATNNPIGYSGGDNGTERRVREHTLLQNAILAVRSQVPTGLNIDGDNDGYVDNVSFIIRGNSGGWAELLWAHRWALYSYDVRINNKRVWDYTFQPENQCDVYVLCHELFHALGAPDLYRYYEQGVPVGPWDLMASGFIHMGAWMKYKYAAQNWISSIPEITTSGTYTLNPLTSATNNAYKIISPYSSNEFFIVEYRRQSGLYETNLPGSGLLIYRIDSTLNGNASGPPDEVYIYRPNGTPTNDGSIYSAHYNSSVGRTEINDFTTNPVSFLANGNIGGLHIHSIGTAGETIQFTVNVGLVPEPAINPNPTDGTFFAYLNQPLTWSDGGGASGYDLTIWKDSPYEVIVENLYLEQSSYLLPGGFESLTTYYWQVDSINDHGSTTGSVWSFTTGTASGPDVVTIGSGSTLANYLPLNMYWRNSLTQTLYLASEIGIEGTLTSIRYNNNFVTDLPNKPVKIWVGETTLTNLSGGWIPSTSLSLIFDGVVSFPSGINTIDIPLQNPYQYNGQNLIIMVNRPMDSTYFNSNDRFYLTTTALSNRTRYLYSDTTIYDPANPSGGTLTNQIANTTLVFQAEADNPPEISLSTSVVHKVMMENSLGNETLVINNQGMSDLEYRLTISSGIRENEGSGRSILGSTLTCDQEGFSPGATQDLIFTVYNASTDNEWLKDLYISFPSGVTVNSATPFVGGTDGNMNPDITSGEGIQIHWHGSGSSGWGVIYPDQSAVATVNITISSQFTGNLELPYQIDGDIYGSEPHTLSGVITLEIDYLDIPWLSLYPEAGTISAGTAQGIELQFDSSELTIGEYGKTIVVTTNDPENPRLYLPVYLTITDIVLTAPENLIIEIDEGSIILSWDEVPGAESYLVEATNDLNTDFVDYSSGQGYFSQNEGRVFWTGVIDVQEPLVLFRVRAIIYSGSR